MSSVRVVTHSRPSSCIVLSATLENSAKVETSYSQLVVGTGVTVGTGDNVGTSVSFSGAFSHDQQPEQSHEKVSSKNAHVNVVQSAHQSQVIPKHTGSHSAASSGDGVGRLEAVGIGLDDGWVVGDVGSFVGFEVGGGAGTDVPFSQTHVEAHRSKPFVDEAEELSASSRRASCFPIEIFSPRWEPLR